MHGWIAGRVLLVALAMLGASVARSSAAEETCPGDCDGDEVVSVDELVRATRIVLGADSLSLCTALDAGGDQSASVDELVLAVLRARFGCRTSERCPFRAGALPSETLPPGTVRGDDMPIDHIVVMMQENRSFDHYFGRLPAAGHTEVDGLPDDASNPDPQGEPVAPFHEERYCTADVNHSWNGSHRQFNDGANDGFVITNEPGGERAMAYYDERDLPYYYALARTFAIGDRYFCSLLGPTYPNRFYLYTGTSFGFIRNVTAVGAYTQRTIFDVLEERGIRWKIYFGDIPFATLFRTLSTSAKVVNVREYFADAAAGTLPQVSFVDAAFFNILMPRSDEHPPGNVQRGQEIVARVANALMNSPLWPRSVLILNYDEHGGFFDHVPPPPACEPDTVAPMREGNDVEARFDRYGFRVPLIVVSPYAKPGYVSHVVYDHTSVLRFIETRFELPALTNRDANADPLTDMFDFSRPALLEPPPLPQPVIDPERVQQCIADGFPG